MEKLDLYKCSVCGNIVQIIINGGGELICCGKPMEKLEAKTFEESLTEKHVPVITSFENGDCEIRVGEILHPMTQEHYIPFIQTISKDKNNVQLKFLHPGEEPKMYLHKISEKLYAREYCNLHGLWEGNND